MRHVTGVGRPKFFNRTVVASLGLLLGSSSLARGARGGNRRRLAGVHERQGGFQLRSR